MEASNQNGPDQPKAILFDLNGTLLDLTEVRRKVNRMLDSKKGFSFWMETFLHYTLVDSCTGQYHEFTAIAEAITSMAAKTFDVKIDRENLEEVFELMKHLPLNEGVEKGLSLLDDKGYRLAVLTNLPISIAKERMERTGLISYFEKLFTAEQIKKYKPSVDTYQFAAQSLNVETGEALMVTAHGWDICGASSAGMRTAFIEKNNQNLYPLAPMPDFSVKTILDLGKLLNTTSSFSNTVAL